MYRANASDDFLTIPAESTTPTQASGHSAQRFALYGLSGTDAGSFQQKRCFERPAQNS